MYNYLYDWMRDMKMGATIRIIVILSVISVFQQRINSVIFAHIYFEIHLEVGDILTIYYRFRPTNYDCHLGFNIKDFGSIINLTLKTYFYR